jgi:hypothetical protein
MITTGSCETNRMDAILADHAFLVSTGKVTISLVLRVTIPAMNTINRNNAQTAMYMAMKKPLLSLSGSHCIASARFGIMWNIIAIESVMI